MKNPMPALAAMALGTLWAGPALAQADAGSENRANPSGLRCSALGDLDEAERTTAVYYLAGYSNGERDAMSFATPDRSAVEQPAAESTGREAAQQQQPQESSPPQEQQQSEGTVSPEAAVEKPRRTGGPPVAVLPTIPAEAIIAACAQSPDSRIVDIITAQGALGG